MPLTPGHTSITGGEQTRASEEGGHVVSGEVAGVVKKNAWLVVVGRIEECVGYASLTLDYPSAVVTRISGTRVVHRYVYGCAWHRVLS